MLQKRYEGFLLFTLNKQWLKPKSLILPSLTPLTRGDAVRPSKWLRPLVEAVLWKVILRLETPPLAEVLWETGEEVEGRGIQTWQGILPPSACLP